MNEVIVWIKGHISEVTLLTTVIPIVISMLILAFSTFKYVSNKSNEMKQTQFENYHRIIDWLVKGRDGHILLDSQIGCVYELRYYKKYNEVSIRILEGLRNNWENTPNIERLLNEIDITLKYLKG